MTTVAENKTTLTMELTQAEMTSLYLFCLHLPGVAGIMTQIQTAIDSYAADKTDDNG